MTQIIDENYFLMESNKLDTIDSEKEIHLKIVKINVNDKMRNTEDMQLKSTYKIQNTNNDVAYGFVTFRENFKFTDSRIFTVRKCYHF